MTEDLERLIDIFEESIRRNGKDYPLTVGHMLNILKMAQRQAEQEDVKGAAADYRESLNDWMWKD